MKWAALTKPITRPGLFMRNPWSIPDHFPVHPGGVEYPDILG
jgi:hypothetical protein